MIMEDLKNIIRDIPDFPKKGIIFKDITTLLQDAQSYQRMIDLISHRYVGEHIDKVVGVEARGFIIGRRRPGVQTWRGSRAGPQAGQTPLRNLQQDLPARIRHRHPGDSPRRHQTRVNGFSSPTHLLATGGTMAAVVGHGTVHGVQKSWSAVS